jgi:transcriptional regulator with XRE-family HTH domain
MTAVNKWSGYEARILRESLRMSMRVFAEHLGVSTRTISKWEHCGRGRRPRPELQAALDTVLHHASPQERERFFDAVGWLDHSVGCELNRRHFRLEAVGPRWAAGVTIDGTLPRARLVHLQQVTRYLDELRQQDEVEVCAYLDRCLAACQRQDGDEGPARAMPSTLALLAAMDAVSREVRTAVRRQVLGRAGRAAEFMGWLYRGSYSGLW